MRKVLLCERNTAGHRNTYLKWLASIPGEEIYVYAPNNVGIDALHFFEFQCPSKKMTLGQYWRWIQSIRKIVRDHGIDTVHFLDGDSIMRYFGLGFRVIGSKKLVITYHHFFEGAARKISYLLMNRVKDTISVVHTENVKKELNKAGIKNVSVCQYPTFDFECIAQRNPAMCKERYHLAQDIPVIGIVGGMCRYKNIIPFLNVMKDCKEPFQLLICGSASDISEAEIMEAIAPYAEKVTAVIRYLSEEEYKDAVAASDIIFCIYGHEFNGASGPLTDGVCAQKMILSCDHGSLGEIVANNDLGITIACDNMDEVLHKTEMALSMVADFVYSPDASIYRSALQPKWFCNRYHTIYSVE